MGNCWVFKWYFMFASGLDFRNHLLLCFQINEMSNNCDNDNASFLLLSLLSSIWFSLTITQIMKGSEKRKKKITSNSQHKCKPGYLFTTPLYYLEICKSIHYLVHVQFFLQMKSVVFLNLILLKYSKQHNYSYS